MVAKLWIDLLPQQRQELTHARDTHPKPYVRERAAAILLMADGECSARAVAHTRLWRRRKADTVCAWWHRYQAQGLGGLLIRAGRGRKPAFSPSQRGASPSGGTARD